MNPEDYHFTVDNVIKRGQKFLKFDRKLLTWTPILPVECLKEHFAPVKTKLIKDLPTYDADDRRRMIRIIKKFENPAFAKKTLERNLHGPQRYSPEFHFATGSLNLATGVFRDIDCHDYGNKCVGYAFEEPDPESCIKFPDRFRYVVKSWLLNKFEKQTASIWLTGPGRDKLAHNLERVFGYGLTLDPRVFADLKHTKSDYGCKIRGISNHRLAIVFVNPEVYFEDFPLRAISGMTGTFDPETKSKFRPQHFGIIFVSEKPPNMPMTTNYYHTTMNRINYFEVPDFDDVSPCQFLHWILAAQPVDKPSMEICYDRPRNHVGRR